VTEQAEQFDVFVSYGHDDAPWVDTLAGNLHRAGLDVFLDKWEIAPGDVLVHQLEEGLRHSRTGILVVSPASVSRPWVREEYAVMVGRAVEGRQRLIPVLLGDVELPPFAANRVWIDFRGADGPEYADRVGELVTAVRDERPERPPRDGQVVAPSGTGVRPEGARRVILRISPDETSLTPEDAVPVTGAPAGLDYGLEELLWQVKRARHQGPQTASAARPSAEGEGAGAAATTAHGRLLGLGKGLAAAFLPDPIREALAKEIDMATGANAALRVRVELDPRLADLLWETLVLPEVSGGPLVLHPRVELYQAVPGLGLTPAAQIPGPLRILVVIGSPDEGERGDLLDYEAELERILDAVEPARRHGRAYVRILNRGTVAETRAALKAERFHVLHLSCHARPGALVLENEQGRPDPVNARRFAEEILVADRGVPLVVLSGCSTALTERISTEQAAGALSDGEAAEAAHEPPDGAVGQGEAALPGLARQLLGYGVPAVLAMNAQVTDSYAARLGARLYQELATQELPEPLTALSEARRQIDADLRAAPAGSRESRLAELAEWATPVLVLRGPSRPLLNPAQKPQPVQPPPEPRLAKGIVVRGVGDFVGRRREERLLLSALRGRRAGVVIHGIGGVGKSTLAAQLIRDLREQAGLVISVHGKVTIDQILDQVGRRLLSASLAMRQAEGELWRQLAALVRDPKVDWADRLDLLGEHLLESQPVVLLLDNFEDNVQLPGDGDRGFEVTDPQLATFLTSWIGAPGMSRLLITSRYPFPLPDHTHRRLEIHHLGPLSLAETRKLVWRLPGLESLEPNELQQAYANVGGHPRALEYLDALLHSGQARFDDVTHRLEQALAARHIDNPTRWLAEVGGDLDRALAETVTLAVNDVLLSQLLDQLEGVPLARRLLLGISVYRLPVDEHGVAWQVAEEAIQPPDQLRHERLRQLTVALQAAPEASPEVLAEQLGLTQAELAELARELTEGPRPPLVVLAGLPDALGHLAELGLVTPADASDLTEAGARPAWLVHRWTAGALARLTANPELVEAHRRAARYWRWRVDKWPQGRQADIADLLEARYHHQAAGEPDEAVRVTEWICLQLETWGAWSWEQQLLQETLTIIPAGSEKAARFSGQIGNIAFQRGDYDQAQERFRKALAILERLGDRAGMATSYHQLGVIAQRRGDYDQALDWYRQALTIDEELGDRAGMATSYHQLGMIAERRGDYDQALDWYRQSLAISEELGKRVNMAKSYHHLGNIAYLRDDYDQALDHYRQALTLRKGLGDRAGMAGTYHGLGLVAEQQGDYDQALDWYRQALAISEELGDRAGMAGIYHQLGNMAFRRDDHGQALDWYRKSLAIKEELGDRAGMATSYLQLGMLAERRGDYDQALDWYRQALAISEELDNRADMASAISAIGILLTKMGNPEEGLRWNLQSMGIRAELGVSQIWIDVRSLRRQLELLGAQRFEQLLQEKLGEEDSEAVKGLLQQLSDNEEPES
jgi:tetratricopeptide (TPR) repeat protein